MAAVAMIHSSSMHSYRGDADRCSRVTPSTQHRGFDRLSDAMQVCS